MAEIPLSQGKSAIVDQEDYDEVMAAGPWHAARRGKMWYARQGGGGKYMHQFLTGFPRTDHRNHNGLDNRRSNLRTATKSQNQANSLLYKNNTSGYKGVTWSKTKQKWVAQICVNYKAMNLGYYENIQDALAARLRAEEHYQGEYAFNQNAVSV